MSVIASEPAGVRLVVVKIQTDQDGLYGYGCATFTQRADLVVAAVDRYLKPFLIGKPTDGIEDLWQAMNNSSYWRNGPVLNNGISGVDQALWGHQRPPGRDAGLRMLGGKCRRAAMIYSHASGREIPEVLDEARKLMSQGIKAVRLQVGVPNMAAYGASSIKNQQTGTSLYQGATFEPAPYIRRTLALLSRRAKNLDRISSCCTMSMSASLRAKPSSWPKTWNSFGSFFLKTPYLPKISSISERFARNALLRSRWESFSTIHTSGPVSLRAASSITSASTCRRPAAFPLPQDRDTWREFPGTNRLARSRRRVPCWPLREHRAGLGGL